METKYIIKGKQNIL